MNSLHVDLAVPLEILVLIGGGEFSFGETREADEYLVAHMPEGRKSVAFLPTASGSAEYAGHFGKYLQTIDAGVTTTNVPIYRGRDSRRQKNVTAIGAAGMVYLGGGVTNNLVSTLRESASELAIREAAAGGAVIAAIGAAASCFGVQTRDMRGGVAALPALGWLRDTVIDTAVEGTDDQMLRRLMSLPDVRLGIGIPAGTALAIHGDGSTEVIGPGQIVTFRKG